MTQKDCTSDHASLLNSSGLFDAGFYCSENPDIKQSGLAPFEHFLQVGGFEGRNPNAYFSVPRYLEDRPEIIESGLNPLVYFLLYESSNVQAFSGFDPIWYEKTYPECRRNKAHPLGHYLKIGREKGFLRGQDDALSHVQEAEIKILRSAPAASETVLFVTHAPNGYIKPHVVKYIKAFRGAGICVIVIIAADDVNNVEYEKMYDYSAGLILRENCGYDFAAWAHALHYVDLSNANVLFFANDSIVGPLDDNCFLSIINRIRKSQAELIGVTDNHEITYHYQSFLFAVKGYGIKMMERFLANVMVLSDKQNVITTYETRFFTKLTECGIKPEVLFPCGNVLQTRSTVHWRELVLEGFPFIKVEVLRIVSRPIWAKILRKYKYPIEYANKTLELTEGFVTVPSQRTSKQKKESRQLGMIKYRFYRIMESITRPFLAERSMQYARRAYRQKKK